MRSNPDNLLTDRGGVETDTARCADVPPPPAGNMVLVVTGSGEICNVLQGHNKETDGTGLDVSGSSLDELGIDGIAERVRQSVRRTLKDRRVSTEEFENAQGCFELMCIAQGRDRALLIIRNLSEQKTVISRVRHLAYIDEPTGLPNREFLLAELGRITDALRLKEGRAALISFDIDKLDLPGYAVGSRMQDAVLKVLAARLTSGLRSVNQPSGGGAERYSLAARIDFRKLSVVLPRIETGADAAAVAQRLADSLQQPIKIDNKTVSVAACAGIALFPQDGTDAITLFENSLAAMEDAKRSRSGQHKFHTGTTQVKALQRHDMELELRSALHKEELELHYLPMVAAETREVATVEALLRWPQTSFGAQSIQRVVTLAEHTGLILPIGEWILNQTCEQLARWHQAGYRTLRLAINLSVQEFSRPDVIEKISEILSNHNISPDALDLEITEHMLFRDAMKEFETCRRLKDIGIGVIVDDYGTGVCSMGHLAYSPVDAIKIDNSFVANSDTSDQDRAACAAAIAMAHELGMRVIAEGVETDAQADILHTLGCDFLQGFLFCKPSPAEAVAEFLDSHLAAQAPGAGNADE